MGGVIALPKLFKQAQAAEAAKLSPTVAEVSQSEATSADGYDLRKTKTKGRSSTIMTSSKGVQDETITLGKKSLLGQ
jgi:hypothetical protein